MSEINNSEPAPKIVNLTLPDVHCTLHCQNKFPFGRMIDLRGFRAEGLFFLSDKSEKNFFFATGTATNGINTL